jgi:hypothetical protein
MKKNFIALMILFACTSFIFAQQAQSGDKPADTQTAVQTANSDSTASSSNSTAEKPVTFDGQKVKLAAQQKVVLPIILNCIPGLGIGSFVQHDVLGGFVGLGLSAAAITCGVFGYSYFVVGILIEGLTKDERIFAYGLCALGGALAFEIGNIVWGIVRPLKFRDKYNAAHGISEVKPEASLSLVPVIVPDGVGAVAVLRY